MSVNTEQDTAAATEDEQKVAAPRAEETAEQAPSPTPQAGPAASEESAASAEGATDDGDQADLVPDLDPTDADRLLNEPVGPVKLSTGSTVQIRPLKLREFLRLLRIITRGGASLMSEIRLNFDDTNEFMQTFMALILFSIPEAEDETVDFVISMVEPVKLTGDPEKDAQARVLLAEELENPELEDMIDILTMIVRKEGKDIQSLGKRLRAMFQTAQKLGAVKTK